MIRNIIKAIIKTLNSPRLNILKGREIIDKIGFKILNPIAKRSPAVRSDCKSP